MLYNVSFIKDNIFQTNLVKTYHEPAMIKLYYDQIIKADKVFQIIEARPDDMKPGKNIIEF